MSTVFEENFLRFEFGEAWQVIQLDDHPSYRNGIEKLDETKAIDFLGVHDNTLYLVEVKDFRNYRIQNQRRLTDGELAIELGQKVRDSIACIIGSARNPTHAELFAGFSGKLGGNAVVKVILWLEHDLPNYTPARTRVRASIQSDVFKKKLKWFHSHVLVANLTNIQIPDTRVSNLSRPQSD